MTVSTTAARAEYTGNGSTTAFAVVDTGGASAVIPVLDATHLQVYVDGTLKTKDTHYTVSIVTATAAATVTFITSPTDYTPASSTSIVILRVIPYTQLQDYVNNDAFDAENVESALDQLTQALHQIVDDKDRSIKFSSTIASSDFNTDEETASKITATKADRASKYLGFDADGDITTLTSITGVTYTETSIAAGHILRYSGSAWVNSNILALDDTKLYFGTDSNISLEYDENGNDTLSFDGGDLLIEDEHNLYFGSNKDVGLYYNEASSDCLNINGEVLIEDDHKLYFGTNKDVSIEYDEAGLDTLLFQSLASQALNIGLYASAGGANEDKWRISVADGGTMTFDSYISGSWVAMMTLVPNGTATDSAITFAGDFTVSGDTTTVNTETLLVEDKNIELGKVGSPSDSTADGGGVTLKGSTDKTILWENDTNQWNVNQKWTENAGSSAFHRPLTTALALG